MTALAAVSRFHRAGSLPHFLERVTRFCNYERVTRCCNYAWSQFVWSVIMSYGQHSTLGEGETLLLLLPLIMHIAHTKCKVLKLLPLLMHIAHTKCKVLLLLPLLPAHTKCKRAL